MKLLLAVLVFCAVVLLGCTSSSAKEDQAQQGPSGQPPAAVSKDSAIIAESDLSLFEEEDAQLELEELPILEEG
ncbi:MAG: hypothetical protein N3G22_03860 [Candidatus Micrarchaeota archaeon]|nr:hypothetical protein [Candidatus Micrarchaeota archaeon]